MHKVCPLHHFVLQSQNQTRYHCGLTQREVEVHVHLALHDGLHKVHTKLHTDSVSNCVELFALPLVLFETVWPIAGLICSPSKLRFAAWAAMSSCTEFDLASTLRKSKGSASTSQSVDG